MDVHMAHKLVELLQPGRQPPTPAEVRRLMAKVRARAQWIPGCSVEDLLQEALAASLPSGRHPIQPGVDCLAHLHVVTHHLARDAVRRLAPHRLSNTVDGPRFDLTDPAERPDPSPDSAAIAQQGVERLSKALEHDETAWHVLQFRLEGESPREIREALDLDQATYDATMKKIRRKARSLK